MDAPAAAPCADGGMENDWQKLGDVVARIAQRLEVTQLPPLARSDADLFVKMLAEIYGPAVPRGAERSRQAAKPEGDAG